MNDERDFDQWLAGEFARRSDYVDDNGFTQRVMTALPAREKSTTGLRLLLVGLVALLVGGLCYTLLPWVGLTRNIATFFLELSVLGLLQLGLAMTLGLMVLAAGALWGERYLYS